MTARNAPGICFSIRSVQKDIHDPVTVMIFRLTATSQLHIYKDAFFENGTLKQLFAALNREAQYKHSLY